MLDQPTNLWIAVAPSDTIDLAPYTQSGNNELTAWVYVGVAGDLACVDQSGTVTIFAGVPAGVQLRVAVRRINLSNTTAQNIVAAYLV